MQRHVKLPQDNATSPTNIPLPTSPRGQGQTTSPQSEFDALIELLATDEPDHNTIDTNNVRTSTSGGSHAHPNSNLKAESGDHSLRDDDGRLDFSKIRALCSEGGLKPPIATSDKSISGEREHDAGSGDYGESELTNPTRADSRSTDEIHAPSVVPSSSSPLRTSAISSLALSLGPPLTENADSRAFEAGLRRVVAESTPRAFRPEREHLDLIDLSSDNPPWSLSSEAAKVPVPPEVQQNRQSESAPPLAAIRTALGLARQEVAALRERCRELENLVRKTHEQSPSQQKDECKPAGTEADTLTPLQGPSFIEGSRQDRQAELFPGAESDIAGAPEGASRALNTINDMSPAETRIALRSLMNDLALPTSCIPALLSERPKHRATLASSLEEIHRSVDMVAFLDELVWRRSRLGAAYDNPYSEENVEALRERLELWERVVRTHRR